MYIYICIYIYTYTFLSGVQQGEHAVRSQHTFIVK